MTARPPATASGWRPRRGAGRRHPGAVDACGVVLLGSDPPPGCTASLSGGRRRVAAGRPACQRAARVLRSATALRVTHRPPRGSDGSYGPCGLDACVPTVHNVPGTRRATELRTPHRTGTAGSGLGSGTAGSPAGGAGCAVSLCRRRVDVLTEPTGGPFSRGRRGPFFSCHFQVGEPTGDPVAVRRESHRVHRVVQDGRPRRAPGAGPPAVALSRLRQVAPPARVSSASRYEAAVRAWVG